MEGHKKSVNTQSGLTLIEIAFAILILGTSFVVILGLQSASVSSSTRVKNSQQAMLIARRMLATIEASEEPLAVGYRQGSAYEILSYLENSSGHGGEGNRLEAMKNEPALASYTAWLHVDYLDIPFMEEDSLKKINLAVAWGEHQFDGIEVIYIIAEDAALLDESGGDGFDYDY